MASESSSMRKDSAESLASEEDIPVGHGKESTLSGMDTDQLMELIRQKTRENASLELLKTLHTKKAKLLEREAAAEAKVGGAEDKKRKSSIFQSLNALSFGKKASVKDDKHRLIHLSELIDAIETYYAAVQGNPRSPSVQKGGRKSILQVDTPTDRTPDISQLFTFVVMKAYKVLDIEEDWPHKGPSHTLDALETFIEKFPGYQLQYKAEKDNHWQQNPLDKEENGREGIGEGTDWAYMVGGPEVDTVLTEESSAVSNLGGFMGEDHKTLAACLRAPSARRFVVDDIHDDAN